MGFRVEGLVYPRRNASHCFLICRFSLRTGRGVGCAQHSCLPLPGRRSFRRRRRRLRFRRTRTLPQAPEVHLGSRELPEERVTLILICLFSLRTSAAIGLSDYDFRGELVFKGHRLLYHSTLGSRVIEKKKKITNCSRLRTSGAITQLVQAVDARHDYSAREAV